MWLNAAGWGTAWASGLPRGPSWKPVSSTHSPGQPCRLASAQTHGEHDWPLWSGGCGLAQPEDTAWVWGRLLAGAQHLSTGAGGKYREEGRKGGLRVWGVGSG